MLPSPSTAWTTAFSAKGGQREGAAARKQVHNVVGIANGLAHGGQQSGFAFAGGLQERTGRGYHGGGSKALRRRGFHRDHLAVPRQARETEPMYGLPQLGFKRAVQWLAARHRDIQPHIRNRCVDRQLALARAANHGQFAQRGQGLQDLGGGLGDSLKSR